MANELPPSPSGTPPPSVRVEFTAFFDEEAGVWVARSEADHITTEAPSEAELENRLRAIVPDVLESRFGRAPDSLQVVINWMAWCPVNRTEFAVA